VGRHGSGAADQDGGHAETGGCRPAGQGEGAATCQIFLDGDQIPGDPVDPLDVTLHGAEQDQLPAPLKAIRDQGSQFGGKQGGTSAGTPGESPCKNRQCQAADRQEKEERQCRGAAVPGDEQGREEDGGGAGAERGDDPQVEVLHGIDVAPQAACQVAGGVALQHRWCKRLQAAEEPDPQTDQYPQGGTVGN